MSFNTVYVVPSEGAMATNLLKGEDSCILKLDKTIQAFLTASLHDQVSSWKKIRILWGKPKSKKQYLYWLNHKEGILSSRRLLNWIFKINACKASAEYCHTWTSQTGKDAGFGEDCLCVSLQIKAIVSTQQCNYQKHQDGNPVVLTAGSDYHIDFHGSPDINHKFLVAWNIDMEND